MDNINKECFCGDLDPKVLENMHNVLGGVFLPVLSNPKNQGGLSEVNARELLESLHVTVSQLYVGTGKTKGETMLPLPPESMVDPGRNKREKDSVHVLETAVVTWTVQVCERLGFARGTRVRVEAGGIATRGRLGESAAAAGGRASTPRPRRATLFEMVPVA